MARGTLHAPKPEGQRRRRNAPTHDTTTLVRDNEIRGPELAEITGRPDWSAPVARWYETWRRSPQAQVFEATDWLRLATLAPIVERYHNSPSASALSEIRMNEERLGATVTDRLRARMVIETADDEDDGTASVTRLTVVRDDVAARMRQGE